MTNSKSEKFVYLIKNKPYERVNGNQISFEGDIFCDVPIYVVEAFVKLLNGAYVEGVTKSFSILTEVEA